MLKNINIRVVTLIVVETVLIVGAVYLSAMLRFGELPEQEAFLDVLPRALLIAGITQLCLYFADLYDLRLITGRYELFVNSMQALGATSLILALVYFWFPELMIGRGVFFLAAIAVVTLVFGWRLAFEWATTRVGPRERLLLVGTTPGAVRLARELFARKSLGVDIVGFIDPNPLRVGAPVLNPGVIGTIEDIPAIVRARSVDRVVVSLAEARGTLPMDKLLDMKLEGVTFEHLASVYEEYTGKIAVENLRPSWLIFSAGFRKSRAITLTKRVMDLAAAIVGLMLAAPLMLLTALAIRLTSSGPVLYHQARVGQHGRVFTVHKFRSMRVDAESGTGAVWASTADSRVTAVGKFLRRTRLDELPQLWNILRGDMSFVGPRPERPEFITALAAEIPFYGQRHVVRPGLTGWAQVKYSYGASVEDALEKLQYDLFYIKNLTIWLDVFIILKTIKTVLMQRGGR